MASKTRLEVEHQELEVLEPEDSLKMFQVSRSSYNQPGLAYSEAHNKKLNLVDLAPAP